MQVYKKRIRNKKEINIALMAGFYNGEGSVFCAKNNGNPYTSLKLSIGQKNYKGKISDTLIKFKKIVKCGHIYRKTRIGKEINQHQFFVSKIVDVKKTLKLLYPYLSCAKKDQAKRALNLYKKGQKILQKNKKIKRRNREKV